MDCKAPTSLSAVKTRYIHTFITLVNNYSTNIEFAIFFLLLVIFLYLQFRCESKESCSVEAHAAVFGDPCVGTSKYLEVDYRCTERKGNKG